MRGDIVINILLLGGALFLITDTLSFHNISKYDAMGPSTWPQIVLVFLMILAAVQLVLNIRKLRQRAETPCPPVIGKTELKKFGLAVTVCIAYFFVMQLVGFILATVAFQVAFLLLQGVRKLAVIVATPLVLVTGFFVLFSKIMYLPLPKGIGIFRAFSLLFN